MQVRGSDYTPIYGNTNDASVYEQVQDMRRADAQLRSDAQRMQAQANADGQSVGTQVTYQRGPDGQNYVSSITITRSETITITQEQGEDDKNRTSQPLQQNMSDLERPRLPLTPSGLVEGFAQRNTQIGDDIAEASALAELQRVDSDVRVHEGLHFRAAGGVAVGVADLEYIQGPDGQYYAVAGGVDVKTATTSNPEQAAREAQSFAAAASAPSDASSQDMAAARGAFSIAAETYSRALDARNTPIAEYDMVA